MTRKLVLPLLLMLCFSTATLAGVPDPGMSSVTGPAGHFYVCPAGDGPTLGSFGLVVDVVLKDAGGAPCPGFPARDIWLEPFATCGGCCGVDHLGNVLPCPRALIADDATDGTGSTSFAGLLPLTGSSLVPIEAFFRTTECPDSGGWFSLGTVPMTYNSLDVSSPLEGEPDGVVDLYDIAYLGRAVNGPYDPLVDFDNNGSNDLFDAILMTGHLDHESPSPETAPCKCDPEPVECTGQIGIYYDVAATQRTVENIQPGVPFTFYVIATGGLAGAGFQAYEYSISYDYPLYIDTEVIHGGAHTNVGSFSSGISPFNTRVAYHDCQPADSTVVLAEYTAVLDDPATDLPINIQAVMLQGGSDPLRPHCPSCGCKEPCPFDTPGPPSCVNCPEFPPTAVQPATWGHIKAIYR